MRFSLSSLLPLLLPLLSLSLSPLPTLQCLIPGISPISYAPNTVVSIDLNKMESTRTQLSYSYYSLPFPHPQQITYDSDAESLGEILSGELTQNSLYKIVIAEEQSCVLVSPPITYPDEQLHQFSQKIKQDYRVNMILDGLPVATKTLTMAGIEYGRKHQEEVTDIIDEESGVLLAHYEKGFPLGFIGSSDLQRTESGVVYINNHLQFKVQLHSDKESFEGFRIVGFEVDTLSIQHRINKEGEVTTCSPSRPLALNREIFPQRVTQLTDDSQHTIAWTYGVQFTESEVKWASRWDVFIKMTDPKIHWFSIINSIMIVLFLSAMVAIIMVRLLNKDLARYNEREALISQTSNGTTPTTPTEDMDDLSEETGWKLIHGDVFRSPPSASWLCTFVGSGVQIFLMTLVTLAFASIGFLSPANRGSLLTGLLFIFVLMAFFSGYTSVRLFKMMKLPESLLKRNIFQTSFFFPGVTFTIFFILNLFVWAEKSSGAVPFVTLLSLLILWICVAVPFTYFGAHIAWKRPTIEHPVKVNSLQRMLPPTVVWYTSAPVSILLGGILPFAAVFIEIFFIMSSVWLNQYYYVFGFLFLVFIILIITCAEISMVLCYFQLLNEDYTWWWRAFFTSASSALYLLIYSAVYFVTKMQIYQFVPGLLFFGYMTLTAFTFALLTGTIGFMACLIFVRTIYAAIKVD